MAKRRLDKNLNAKVQRILRNAVVYHNRFRTGQRFTGPSLYFHRRALGLAGRVSFNQKVEAAYAVLTAWGMHRMGKNGSKMLPFDDFRRGMLSVRPEIQRLSTLQPASLSPSDWVDLEKVFKKIRVMASGTVLVGHSKAMAHFLPDLIPPVDRRYTIKYLFGSQSITNGMDGEWLLMKKLLTDFFYPVARNPGFRARAARWIANQRLWPWDTSLLKVVDNLVIGVPR